MSKINNLPKTLPEKEMPFEYSGVGELTQHKYTGSFVVRVPSTREISKIGIEVAKLSGGVPPDLLDNATIALNRAIAFLSVCLVESPAWFCNSPDDEQEAGISYGLDSHDLNIPIEIYKKADELVEGWHQKLRQGNDEAK
jgi:hypothetical protein